MNLLITCSRHFETDAIDETFKILEFCGDTNPTAEITELSGILTATTLLNPFDVVKKIREKILEEPWSVRYLHRIIPIQETILTQIEEITNAILRHTKSIESHDTYRITVEKRNSTISSDQIIEKVADCIQNKVSLKKFDWNILIEIIGRETGISVLKEEDVISVQKLKRSLSE